MDSFEVAQGFMLPKIAYLHALAHINGLGPKSFSQLQSYYQNDIYKIWDNANKWSEKIFKGKTLIQANSIISSFDLERELDKIDNSTINITHPEQSDYPSWLKEIPDRPFILYSIGKLPEQTRQLITVVGTRKISPYGKQVVEYLLSPLAHNGVGIISGLAFGIDAECHALALKENSYTAAVLASGVDYVTPRRHQFLADQIIQSGGSIISEFCPGTPSHPCGYPQRNRIIAGMSPATLVIEAASKSGALITAYHALDYNRDVAAAPGSVFSNVSCGCNTLIKKGAYLIQTPEDLLELYQIKEDTPQIQNFKLDDDEEKLISVLTADPILLDKIIEKSRLKIQQVLPILTMLEIKGLITKISGRGYQLKKNIKP